MSKATVKAYASPSCVLLTFDWSDGVTHADFLGFAIERSPGYTKKGDPQFLFNKLDFVPIAKGSKPKGSDVAPIQKFNWWDGGLKLSDRGRTFQYTITPVLGTGPTDLKLQTASSGVVDVAIPNSSDGKIATYFNRAVVSAQSFLSVKDDLKVQMEWLANGLQEAIPEILSNSDAFDCAIYHLSDGLWIVPAFMDFAGRGSITYFNKGDDDKSQPAIDKLNATKHNISTHKRDAISKLMHDKFVVSHKDGSDVAVLMGSTNFTPEAQTIQANLLHIIQSPQLAKLYQTRSTLLAANKKTKDTAVGAGWKPITDVAGSDIRVFFLPEPGSERQFLDTVTDAVKAAKSSVLFCMFTASDTALMDAIFAQADSKDHLVYGLLNAIDDPEKPTKSGAKRNLPEIAATIYHRSREKPDTLPYSAFGKNAPRGFLPELRTIDCSKYDLSVSSGKKKNGGPPPIHIHHKFIVIDGDTAHPTIYTGSPNFSKASENSNDENVLEIKNNEPLAHAYVAEFMRLYNHYRARAIWNRTHEKQGAAAATGGDPLVLKTKRDDWVGEAYRDGSKSFLARTRGL
ncbi:phospholipase D-like domain-containing protein [Mesorhizobium sp. LCM 4577]|uniref:phospholipase D-like domain-containing protein n=1 Tax=Mesorhizobium sp. LCM 4577 TaxID=1848288 RepID=UPI0009F2144A|nr:phospholipase D-like domain-containing protein [Mesorhizobium sp. LCM 4577]